MVTVTVRSLFVLPVLAGALLLSGCGSPGTEPGSGGGGGPATSAPSASPSASVSLPPAQTGVPTASGRPITVEGIVEDGVEPGCKVLAAGGSVYLILGGTDVPTGVPVRVKGVLTPGVLSTCQQGTPLRVTDVQRR